MLLTETRRIPFPEAFSRNTGRISRVHEVSLTQITAGPAMEDDLTLEKVLIGPSSVLTVIDARAALRNQQELNDTRFFGGILNVVADTLGLRTTQHTVEGFLGKSRGTDLPRAVGMAILATQGELNVYSLQSGNGSRYYPITEFKVRKGTKTNPPSRMILEKLGKQADQTIYLPPIVELSPDESHKGRGHVPNKPHFKSADQPKLN